MILQLVIIAIINGSLYALIAIGLTLIFGVMGVVNFAHSNLLMLSLFFTFWIFSLLGMNPYLGLLFLVPIFFLIGKAMYHFLIKPVLDKPIETQICVTFGLSFVLSKGALLLWGPRPRVVKTAYDLYKINIFNSIITLPQLFMFITSVIVLISLSLFLNKTYTGKAMRAVSQNRIGAQLLGINTDSIYSLAFGIGMICVAMAGATMSPMYPITPFIGNDFLSIAFIIVVFGGVKSLVGTVIAAIILSFVETGTSFFITIHLKNAILYMTFITILLVKPMGLINPRKK